MSTTVTYKDSILTTIENQTRTLKTAGKYMEGDIVLADITAETYPDGDNLEYGTVSVPIVGQAIVGQTQI